MEKYILIFLVLCTSSSLARQCNDCCNTDNTENCCSNSCCSSCNSCPTSTCRSRCQASCPVITTQITPQVEPQKTIMVSQESPRRHEHSNNHISNTNLSNSTTTINLNNTINNVNTIHVPINISSVNTNTIHVSKTDSERRYDTPSVVTHYPLPVTRYVPPPQPVTPRYFFYVIRQPVYVRSGCCGPNQLAVVICNPLAIFKDVMDSVQVLVEYELFNVLYTYTLVSLLMFKKQ
ncbi:hypothetical protein WA026_016844 [Henosepilachna vigintioctopunctata]|uniref:Uncharacterized protein n=1 Tax=Henosepilachna vigintioctopunctata TaxID=420089 RepID=A0AAW1U2G9_9CUCU